MGRPRLLRQNAYQGVVRGLSGGVLDARITAGENGLSGRCPVHVDSGLSELPGRALVPPRQVPVYDWLERVLDEVHAGYLAPSQAQATAAVARAMVTVLTSDELEQRVRELEGRR